MVINNGFNNKFSRKLTASMLTLMVTALCSGLSADALTVNNGDTLTYEVLAGQTEVVNDANFTINGIIRVYEIDGSGLRTGNGGNLSFISPGSITLGSTGLINLSNNGAGSGGILTLNGNLITLNGKILALGSGNGNRAGIVNLITNNLSMGALSVIDTRGVANAKGGKINIDASGIVNIAAGSLLNTSGGTSASNNLITIDGSGVNIDGRLFAMGSGTGTGGVIAITETGGGIFIGAPSQVNASSGIGHGGTVNLSGNTIVEGDVLVHSASSSKKGGFISITGTNAQSFTLQNGGQLYADGRSGPGNSGDSGDINILTGTVNLNNGFIKSRAGESGGTIGDVSIRATSGNITTGNGFQVIARGSNGGNIDLRADNGSIDIGTGSAILAEGNQTTNLTMNADGITIAGVVEAGGRNSGNGGTLTLNALNNTDVTINSRGVVSSRGGQSGGADGGTVNINATRDFIIQGLTSGGNLDRPNDANIRAYGTKVGAGALGEGGVITITAGRNYISNEFTNINAKGKSVASGGTFTKSVVKVVANADITLDGLTQVGGRSTADGGGGLIDISSTTGDITVNPGILLGATVSGAPGAFNGDGGRIDLTATQGDVTINGGNAIIEGIQRGLIDLSSGVVGDGGVLNITSKGNTDLNNINILGSGGTLGGIVNILASSGTINIDANTSISTRGGASSSSNMINLTSRGNTITGNLIASSTTTEGGTIRIEDTNSAIGNTQMANYVNLANTNLDLNGQNSGANGTLHIVGTTVTTTGGGVHNFSRNRLHVESTSGNIRISRDLTAREITLTATQDVDIEDPLTSSNTINIGFGHGGDITINAGRNAVLDHSLNANANSSGGHAGNITVNAGQDILMNASNSDITALGYVRTAGENSNGGNVTFSAGRNVTIGTGSTFNLDSRRNADVQASSANGGDVIISAGNNITLNTGGNDTIISRGASFFGGNVNGGNGGNVTFNAKGGNIDLNDTTSSNGYYFSIYGGRGTGTGDGGNGGNVNFNTNGNVTIQNQDTSAGGNGNFYRIGGFGSPSGSDGKYFINGVEQ